MNKRSLSKSPEKDRTNKSTPMEGDRCQGIADAETMAEWKRIEAIDTQISHALKTRLNALPVPPVDRWHPPLQRQITYALLTGMIKTLRFAGKATVAIILILFIMVPLAVVFNMCRVDNCSIQTGRSASSRSPITPTPILQPSPTVVPSIANPPAVPNPEQARLYSGQEITFWGDGVGLGPEIDLALAKAFEQATGIRVNIYPRSRSETESYPTYERFFQEKSPSVDVLLLDEIRVHAFASHLVDLSDKLGTAAKQHDRYIVQNNTVDGRLVAMPLFSDRGVLYYRWDLLQRYGYTAPPQTWEQLEEMARTIQKGERERGKTDFYGFEFQAAPYEGLTCVALEWLASQNGGMLIDNGKVTINNEQAIKALNRARSWIGTISPKSVTTDMEDSSREIFQHGNAAFLRHWPTAYALLNDPQNSSVANLFRIAPLPHDSGQESVGIMGGQQLGVSKYSKHPDAAIEFVRYMTSPETIRYRASVGGYIPTIETVREDPLVQHVLPFMNEFQNIRPISRPSAVTGANYEQVSTTFSNSVNQILLGADAAQVVPLMEQKLQRILATTEPTN